jgi:prepilin-type N-terminal cleavage/methylation domain-containing protein
MTRRDSRGGFTLVELLAALAVSGLALLGGILLLDQLTDSTTRITRRGLAVAREANGLRVLRQLLLDAQVSADSSDRFRGDARATDFSSMCQHPGGWRERCRASLSIDRRADSSVAIAMLPRGEFLELARWPGEATLRYFDVLARDSMWTDRWAPSITMPAAIGIVVGTDTLVYPLGATRD